MVFVLSSSSTSFVEEKRTSYDFSWSVSRYTHSRFLLRSKMISLGSPSFTESLPKVPQNDIPRLTSKLSGFILQKSFRLYSLEISKQANSNSALTRWIVLTSCLHRTHRQLLTSNLFKISHFVASNQKCWIRHTACWHHCFQILV